jgi:hypothetical protein
MTMSLVIPWYSYGNGATCIPRVTKVRDDSGEETRFDEVYILELKT